MTEYYVSMEQAKRLHDLGFDGVDKYYVTESFCYGGNPDDFYQEGQMVDEYIVYFINEDNEDDYRGVPAPRLDQAAAWLREEKGIHVEPHFQYATTFRCAILSEGLQTYKFFNSGYDSYESALSAGISAALELLGKEVKE